MMLDEIRGRYGLNYGIEFERLIKHYAPDAERFLEWGSGETTEILCELAKSKNSPFVLSIDDNKDYLLKISENLPLYSFLHLRLLDLQGPSFSQNDTYPNYSSYPFLLGLKFDVAFVDGRRRAECCLNAAQVVEDTGIVIVHDWQRSRYKPMRALFETIHEGPEFLVLRPKAKDRDEDITTSARRAIFVPARGSLASKELSLTLPRTEEYARRIGADCIVFAQDSNVPNHRLKAEILDKAYSYDSILLIDADIIIRDGAPDIFQYVDSDSLGAFPEGQFFLERISVNR